MLTSWNLKFNKVYAIKYFENVGYLTFNFNLKSGKSGVPDMPKLSVINIFPVSITGLHYRTINEHYSTL
jgi:hypothetical protein